MYVGISIALCTFQYFLLPHFYSTHTGCPLCGLLPLLHLSKRGRGLGHRARRHNTLHALWRLLPQLRQCASEIHFFYIWVVYFECECMRYRCTAGCSLKPRPKLNPRCGSPGSSGFPGSSTLMRPCWWTSGQELRELPATLTLLMHASLQGNRSISGRKNYSVAYYGYHFAP